MGKIEHYKERCKRIKEENDSLRKENYNICLQQFNDNTYSYFIKMFKSNYEYAECKRQKNRLQNFFWKKVYVIVMIMGLIVSVAFGAGYYIAQSDHSLGVFAGYSTIGIIITALILAIISRGLSIYKCQETWARHSKQQYTMDREILLFIEELAPYNTEQKKELFILNCVLIWDGNIDKFRENMENKEEKLISGLDVLSNIK